ncbi:glycerate kinase [Streptomyces sp. NPDC048258]|uniref:glycerate kinase n=1 Tax=Streptomyces sp. NPDC048258 TaxID=3365527 RepID=UPI0037170AEA
MNERETARTADPWPVVVAPNPLRGYATSSEVAAALAEGVRRARPGSRVLLRPLADGGDGTLDALRAALGGTWRDLDALDARGRVRRTGWLALDPRRAAVETARVSGLGALLPHELKPLEAGSAGAGQAVAAAVVSGATSILLGLGGTAVVDGGAGALAALGARFLDADGRSIDPLPYALPSVARVDLEPARRLLAGVTVRLLSDVRTPLAGNLEGFGAQKGVTDADRPVAVQALHHLTRLLADAGDATAHDRFDRPWYGAGGGIGFGVAAVAATTAESGATGLLDIVDPEDTIGTAALTVTAEGVIDEGTWRGKLPGAVAQRRLAHGRPTAMVAVRVTAPLPDRLISTHRITRTTSAPAVTGAELRQGLAGAAAEACRTWAARDLLEQA